MIISCDSCGEGFSENDPNGMALFDGSWLCPACCYDKRCDLLICDECGEQFLREDDGWSQSHSNDPQEQWFACPSCTSEVEEKAAGFADYMEGIAEEIKINRCKN